MSVSFAIPAEITTEKASFQAAINEIVALYGSQFARTFHKAWQVLSKAEDEQGVIGDVYAYHLLAAMVNKGNTDEVVAWANN